MNAICSPSACNSCPGNVVCRCLGVTAGEIVTVIETLGLRTVKEVRARTGAGDGCTCCHAQIRVLLAENSPSLAAAG
jgi:NAD(P)H-nitrite reductase large subunit